MKLVERVKIFTGADTEKLEQQYADWYDRVVKLREGVPSLKGNPIKILERRMVIRNYKGEETYALAIFYEDMMLEAHEKGPDRGGHLQGGVSLIAGQKPRKR